MSNRCAVFLDGGYLDKILLDLGKMKIDYSKMVVDLHRDLPLLRAYYYNCLPYQSPTPTPDEQQRVSEKQKFFTSLNRLANFTVREGKLAKRGTDSDGKPIFEQKRIDVHLATDLVMHSTKRLITHALLFAGDSDFIPAIEIAESEGVNVRLFSVESTASRRVGARPHDELVNAVDEHIQLKQAQLEGWVRRV
ncbi:MAG: NYN domain-containing protein [Bacilli bacterium]